MLRLKGASFYLKTELGLKGVSLRLEGVLFISEGVLFRLEVSSLRLETFLFSLLSLEMLFHS